MIKILLVALVINVIFWIFNQAEWYESLGIALAVLIATFVATFSEYKNENAFKKLQAEASKIFCKVYRNSAIQEVAIDDLVKDDLVILQDGDKIPCDCVIIEGEIKVDQSALNGESVEVTKKVAPIATDKDFSLDDEFAVFRGSIVCSGEAIAKVIKVGDNTVYGNIAKELQESQDRDTPLKVKLTKLAGDISRFGYIGGIAIAIAYLAHCLITTQVPINEYVLSIDILKDLLHAVMFAVIIIVMAVPEGLPLMIAIVSALNMGKMLKDNVLIRKVAGIETAGSLNILFSDKTGTITKGKLEVTTFVTGNGTELNSFSNINDSLKQTITSTVLGNTQCFISEENNDYNIVGSNATDKALCRYVISEYKSKKDYKVIHSIPFSSKNKYSTTSVEVDSEVVTFIKGAPEKILDKCNSYYDENGNIIKGNDFEKLKAKIEELSNRAIRVLLLATSNTTLTEESDFSNQDITLVGIVGIRDEIRPEAAIAISEVNKAGIQVVVITGDKKETASAIAKEIGLVKHESDLVLTSEELNNLSDEDLKTKLPNLRVVARALPSDKSRLVRLAQSLDLVVGMTGDGINDSPALKKSDVGFAMGGGTEVAKEASEIVILDDNFNSIQKAILYGRTIFNSIRKFIIFQLTVNVAAVIISFLMPLLGSEMPLTIVQILWINLVMDTLAALALGGEPALQRYMEDSPKSRSEHIINKYMASSILVGAFWIFVIGMALLFCTPLQDLLFHLEFSENEISLAEKSEIILTSFFTLFIFATVFNAFNARTESLNIFSDITKNKGFISIIGLIVIVQIIMTQSGTLLPTLGKIMSCHGLSLGQWAVVLVMAVTIIPVDLVRKVIVKKLGIKA